MWALLAVPASNRNPSESVLDSDGQRAALNFADFSKVLVLQYAGNFFGELIACTQTQHRLYFRYFFFITAELIKCFFFITVNRQTELRRDRENVGDRYRPDPSEIECLTLQRRGRIRIYRLYLSKINVTEFNIKILIDRKP
jgi:hypothetical protein